MKILILDDTPGEWFSWQPDQSGFLDQVAAAVDAKLRSKVQITVSFDGQSDDLYGKAAPFYRCVFDIRTLNSTKQTQERLLTLVKRKNFDLYLIDCSIDNDDRSQGGAEFAKRMADKFKINDNQICIVTNKDKVEDIRKGTVAKVFGRFVAILKDSTSLIAAEVVNRVCAPFRPSIPVTERCNRAVHDKSKDSRTAINEFFHSIGVPKSIVLCACDDLVRSADRLPETLILKAAVGAFCKSTERIEVESHLDDYLWDVRKLAVMPKTSFDADLWKIGSRVFGKGSKLADVLFPRIRTGSNESFRKWTEALWGERFALKWDTELPSGLSVSGQFEGSITSSVPASWFKVFGSEWEAGLKAAKVSLLKVAVVKTREPFHQCVVVWNGGKGYLNRAVLASNAPMAFHAAAPFSHVFVITKHGDGSVSVVEVLPNNAPVREIPSLRVCVGETVFDFRDWAEGSAYLFMVPGC